MLTADAYLKATAGVVALVFALIFLAGRSRSTSRFYLGAFFLLICGNQFAEATRAMLTDPRDQVMALRVATVFAALDPLALYGFASLHPRPNRLRRPLPLALVILGSATFAFAAPTIQLSPLNLPAELPRYGLSAFTLVVYVVALVESMRGLRDDPTAAASQFFPAAMAVAAVPLGARMAGDLFTIYQYGQGNFDFHQPGPLALQGLLRLAGLMAMILLIRHLGRGAATDAARRATRGAMAFGAGVTALLEVANVNMLLHVAGSAWVIEELHLLGRSGTSIRWLVFGALISMAVLRDRMLEMSLRARKASARVVVALAGVVVLLPVLLWGSTVSLGGAPVFRTSELVLLAVALGLSQGFRRLIESAAYRLYGVPRRDDEAARALAYQLAARQFAEAPSAAVFYRLEQLREELELSPEAAARLRAVVDPAAGALHEGLRVQNRYEIVRLLGSGSAGRVFLARDDVLGRNVVLKELPAKSGEAVEAALREARLASAIQHPNLVTLHDVIRRSDTIVLVCEYVAGGSVAEAVAVAGPFDERAALRLVEDILKGLAALHARGVVHRDIKPSNVMLTRDGRAKIGDFGIAATATEAATRTDAFVAGTPAYMAPEQHRGASGTARSDVYAVGLIVQRCIATPLHPAVQRVVDKALAEKPEDRWSDAREMLAALQQPASGEPGASVGPAGENASADGDPVHMA